MRKAASWGAFLAIVAGSALLAGPTSLGGPASYVIVSGNSMEPTYYDGDLVVGYKAGAYGVGETIVYGAPVDAEFNVIHRIIERTDGGFITQGDNRDEPDGWIAPDDEIYGKALFHIPRGGAVVTFLRQPAAILAFLAGWLTLAIFDRRRPSGDQASRRGNDADRPDGDAENAEDHPVPAMSAASTHPLSSELMSKEKAKEPVNKKTVAIMGIAALIGGSAGVMVANAAGLRVDGGVLQAFLITDLPEPPAQPLAASCNDPEDEVCPEADTDSEPAGTDAEDTSDDGTSDETNEPDPGMEPSNPDGAGGDDQGEGDEDLERDSAPEDDGLSGDGAPEEEGLDEGASDEGTAEDGVDVDDADTNDEGPQGSGDADDPGNDE